MTDNEKDILNILWRSGDHPLTSREIERKLDPVRWNTPKLFRMLNSMQQKGYIEVCGFAAGGKHYTRQFRPLLSREDFYVGMMKEDGISTRSVLKIAACLLGADVKKKKNFDADDRVIEELNDIISRIGDDTGDGGDD